MTNVSWLIAQRSLIKKRESGTNLSANQTRLINNGWARPDGLGLSHSDPMKVKMQRAVCRLELLFWYETIYCQRYRNIMIWRSCCRFYGLMVASVRKIDFWCSGFPKSSKSEASGCRTGWSPSHSASFWVGNETPIWTLFTKNKGYITVKWCTFINLADCYTCLNTYICPLSHFMSTLLMIFDVQ